MKSQIPMPKVGVQHAFFDGEKCRVATWLLADTGANAIQRASTGITSATHWAEIPALDDQRWRQGNPWSVAEAQGVDVLIQCQMRDTKQVLVCCQRKSPRDTANDNYPVFHGAIAWMLASELTQMPLFQEVAATQDESIAMKAQFKAFWDQNGIDASLPPDLQELADLNPLECGEAMFEFPNELAQVQALGFATLAEADQHQQWIDQNKARHAAAVGYQSTPEAEQRKATVAAQHGIDPKQIVFVEQ